jgi:hypothetical protein
VRVPLPCVAPETTSSPAGLRRFLFTHPSHGWIDPAPDFRASSSLDSHDFEPPKHAFCHVSRARI